MNGFAYAELYVADSAAAVGYFTDGMDFDLVADARQPGRYSVLLRAAGIQLIITSPSTRSFTGHDPVGEWLEDHGDGVADVAMYCRSTPETITRAALAGLPVIRRVQHGADGHVYGTVAGIGSLQHTLIDPGHATSSCLPPGFPWQRREAHPSGSRGLQAIDHVAVCLPAGSLGMAAQLYEHVFGLREYSRELRPGGIAMDSRVLRDETKQITYVLAEPTPEASGGQVEQFTQQHGGAGVQHLAFSCTAITDTVAHYTDRGVAFCATPAEYYRQVPHRMHDHPDVERRLADLERTGVLVAADHGGELYQIFTRSPHQPDAVFYELIQRIGGAEGFGADNIAALFAARQAETTRTAAEH